jgi:hypothetical protein
MSNSLEMMTLFPMTVSVEKRHTLVITVQLTLYSIVIGITCRIGQQETKVSAELLWTNRPWKALLVLAHRVDNHTLAGT